MKRFGIVALAFAALALLSGCLDVTSVVAVKKDGSGTITETVYLGAAAMGMMSQVAMGMGGPNGGPPPSPFADVDVQELKDKAAKMGEGVTYAMHKQVNKPDGSEGLQVVYKFTDINKLKISMNPDAPGGAGGPMGGTAAQKKEDDPITFKMTKGAKPQLVINMPKPKKEADADGDEASDAPPPDMMGPNQAQAKAMMKQMFDGFRFRVLVKLIDGEIAKSNATYQGLDPKTKKKQYITLMDVDLGKLMQDEKQLDKLAKMGQMSSMVEAREKLKDIEGLKVETEEKVTVDIK